VSWVGVFGQQEITPPPHHGNWGEQSHIKNGKLIYSIWAITVLVLLTQQHYYIKSTNTFGNFDHMLAPILMVQLAKLHQYMGATDTVAPMYWGNWASCTNRCRNTNILRILRFRWFFYVCITITSVKNWLSASTFWCIAKRIKMLAAPRHSVKPYLINQLEWSGNSNTCFKDGGQFQRQKTADHHKASICHLPVPTHFSFVPTFNA
jgi:hypothetical protein